MSLPMLPNKPQISSDGAGTASTVGGHGTGGTNGIAETIGSGGGVKGMSPEALRELMKGAKVGAPKQPSADRRMPWEQLDSEAPPDRAMSLRTNAYERALLRYVAGLRGESVQQTIKQLLREAALAAAATSGQ
jgi:hypothetical protein